MEAYRKVCKKRTRSVIRDEPGSTRGLKLRLRGQIGVRSKACTEGCTIGPPHEREYAVEPVGVDSMRPSDFTGEVSWEPVGKVKSLPPPQLSAVHSHTRL